MGPRTITFVFLLSVSAIGSWYLARSNAPSDEDDLPYEPLHQGYYLKQARILGTGEDGSLLYEIEADHAEQQEDDSIEFNEVRIRFPGKRCPLGRECRSGYFAGRESDHNSARPRANC